MSGFVRENGEIPGALRDLVAYYRGEGRAKLRELARLVPAGRSILFSGMGTSEITPHQVLARLRAAGHAGATVDCGEWHHHGAAPGNETAVVLTSQSGESVELKAIVRGHLAGRPYIAVTNDPASTLARGAALTLPLRAGAESSITTKTFTNNLALLELVCRALTDPVAVEAELDALETTAGLMETLDTPAVVRAAAALRDARALAFVGRGPGYVSSRQAALTFMEGTRRLTSAYTGGAFNHGPMEAVEPGFAAVVFVAAGPTERLAAGLVERAAERGATVVAFTDGRVPLDPRCHRVSLPAATGVTADSHYPLRAARAHNQVLAELTRLVGIEVGDFRYGGKVTVTE